MIPGGVLLTVILVPLWSRSGSPAQSRPVHVSSVDCTRRSWGCRTMSMRSRHRPSARDLPERPSSLSSPRGAADRRPGGADHTQPVPGSRPGPLDLPDPVHPAGLRRRHDLAHHVPTRRHRQRTLGIFGIHPGCGSTVRRATGAHHRPGLVHWPFVYLLVLAALQNMDPKCTRLRPSTARRGGASSPTSSSRSARLDPARVHHRVLHILNAFTLPFVLFGVPAPMTSRYCPS